MRPAAYGALEPNRNRRRLLVLARPADQWVHGATAHVTMRSDAQGIEPAQREKALAAVDELLPPDGAVLLESDSGGIVSRMIAARRQAIMNILAERAIEAANRDECGECGLECRAA